MTDRVYPEKADAWVSLSNRIDTISFPQGDKTIEGETMNVYKKIVPSMAIMVVALMAFLSTPCRVASGDSCASGVAIPPFLSTDVMPNMLIMIDNSASMYDLAYVAETSPSFSAWANGVAYLTGDVVSDGGDLYEATSDGTSNGTGVADDTGVSWTSYTFTTSGCYDESYQSAEAYAGYFESGEWYAYSFSDEEFQQKTSTEADTAKASATYIADEVLITIDATPSVTSFFAKGNLLNWAAMSKLDVEKKILTGGKYDAADGVIVMESRGCLNRRMIKKVPVEDSGGSTFYLTLGIMPPTETTFDPWEDSTLYTAGDVVSELGVLYQTAAGGTSSGTGVYDDTGVTDWTAYTLTRWTNGTVYPAGSIVTDPANLNTLDEGTLYITEAGGTASGSGVKDDSGITDWKTYNTTHIEIFNVTANGFDNSACQSAVDELAKENPNQGQLKSYIQDCMGYTEGVNKGDVSNYMASFNHAIHNCWYMAKKGDWPPGAGPVQAIKPACEALYDAGIEPWDITTDSKGYVCYGVYDVDPLLRDGYVGRCWVPAGGTKTCLKTNASGKCTKWDITGYTSATWESDECIEAALQDYCGMVEIPEVIDPTDQAGETGEFWNLPAVLIDSGVVGQIGNPLAVIKGRIEVSAAPEGMLEDFADEIRMGVMVFNDNGAKAECASPDPHILYECFAENRDGGKVVVPIDEGTAHTTTLISEINEIKANAWTPMAEAVYTAMKYYTQDSTDLLNSAVAGYAADPDFPLTDPEIDPCQAHNILIITEGASTADLNSTVETFAGTAGQHDTDTDPTCTSDLSASTALDDLTYYLNEVEEIKTHIVAIGTPRSTGTDECSPNVLLENAAINGGTTLNTATSLSDLEDKLRWVMSTIRAGSSSGSAASVISSSRGGEGAIYQAIFWPEIELPETADPVKWAGEVHGLFVDTYGQVYEDTNQNKTLDVNDEMVVVYFDESVGQTKACYGALETDGTCSHTSKDIREVKYLWSAMDWLAGISNTDVLTNRASADYISNVEKRYIFTWEDLNNNGVVDSTEQVPFEQQADFTTTGVPVSGSRGSVILDFGVSTTAEVNNIIKWIRGEDQAGMRNRTLTYDHDGDGTESTFTWRLGDVIHSTPTTVASPSEGYHLLYKDTSYGNFVSHYQKRRHMVYFGGNDGMLHAVNAGFFNADSNKVMKTPDGTSEDLAPELGAELWAYVPYNLLAHLKCLTSTTYSHKYYVDLRPRLFDVKIFTADTDHPGGWGTILVGGMRFGGAPVVVSTVDGDGDGSPDLSTDPRTFISAYFILDVTNPEKPPVLLGEMTMNGIGTAEANMGYTTGIPTVVPMVHSDSGTNKWYLILGSGPTDVDGTSSQNVKLAVFPLDILTDATPGPFQIPDAVPASGTSYAGRWQHASFANSFASDLITVDYDLKSDYMADVVYFGSVGGASPTWDGEMYRLITRKMVSGVQDPTTPDQWTLNTLIDTGTPITAAPTVGVDSRGQYWVFFGSGRFFHASEKAEATQQAFYGIKEPMDCTKEFTWATVEKTGAVNSTPGAQGLLRVDGIKVNATGVITAPLDFQCEAGDTACSVLQAAGVATFSDLENYIAGSGCAAADPTGTDGWYREFVYDKERNLGQGALLGGLLTFTTFKPFDDPCLTEGLSYLYGIYMKTGTSWYKPVFETILDNGAIDGDGNIIDTVDLGRGMSTTPNIHLGKSEGSKAFVQTSTGAILEIPQVNLPVDKVKTGRENWLEKSD